MNNITLLSPAKVNLTLEILRIRQDMYHDIRSIVQPIDIFDQITVEIIDEPHIELETIGNNVPSGEKNLAYIAAQTYLNSTGINKGVYISLNKKIPTGAGLGGGSGNAAAVLTGLNKLFKRFSDSELAELSAPIGADVPFFILNRTGLVEGIGEKVTIIRDFPLLNYVVVNPDFELSTKEVYEKFDSLNSYDPPFEDINQIIEGFKNGRFTFRNDLEKAATGLHLGIEQIRGLLEGLESGAVSMTGSGPTFFCAFWNETDALTVYDYLKDSSNYNVFLAKGIAGWHRL